MSSEKHADWQNAGRQDAGSVPAETLDRASRSALRAAARTSSARDRQRADSPAARKIGMRGIKTKAFKTRSRRVCGSFACTKRAPCGPAAQAANPSPMLAPCPKYEWNDRPAGIFQPARLCMAKIARKTMQDERKVDRPARLFARSASMRQHET